MDDDSAKYYRKPWMSDDQWYCAMMWADIMCGFHHCGNLKPCGYGIEVSERAGAFSTFDFDRLTRAVLLAHDRCVRLQLAGSGPGQVKFMLHRRHARDGGISERHPTIDQAIAIHRKAWPETERAIAESAGK